MLKLSLAVGLMLGVAAIVVDLIYRRLPPGGKRAAKSLLSFAIYAAGAWAAIRLIGWSS
ncbi:hypothetical protein [Acidocella facilis]|uniref:hypothetical protein n=1 Tax=Acidocella facilis TaxID=525 RepID=UPI001F189BFE|nr:hypothetical protein [Acidocella facilis]